MIDFHKYIGEHIVLVTNFAKSLDRIIGIRTDLTKEQVFTYKKQFVRARMLRVDDLKDEDFVQWLNAMWPNETILKQYKTYKKPWINEEPLSASRKLSQHEVLAT